LISRLPGNTKGRDKDVVSAEVLQAGLTLQEFEKLFVNAIVDVYNQEWDKLRGQTAYNLWVLEDLENCLIPPMWLGNKDELKLLLMKEEKSRIVDRHGISFRGRFYQNITMLRALQNQRIQIRYDKRDISVIYVYTNDGVYFCEAYCDELRGTRLSIWEDDIRKSKVREQIRENNLPASRNMDTIVSHSKKKRSKKTIGERQAQFIEQVKIFDEQDIHIGSVEETFRSTNGDLLNETIEVIPVKLNTNVAPKKLVVRDL
jgi:hypothetical protein